MESLPYRTQLPPPLLPRAATLMLLCAVTFSSIATFRLTSIRWFSKGQKCNLDLTAGASHARSAPSCGRGCGADLRGGHAGSLLPGRVCLSRCAVAASGLWTAAHAPGAEPLARYAAPVPGQIQRINTLVLTLKSYVSKDSTFPLHMQSALNSE